MEFLKVKQILTGRSVAFGVRSASPSSTTIVIHIFIGYGSKYRVELNYIN